MSATAPPSTWLNRQLSAWLMPGCWASAVRAGLGGVGGAGRDVDADQGLQGVDVAFAGQADPDPVIAGFGPDVAAGGEGLAHPADDRPGEVYLCLVGVVQVDDLVVVGGEPFAGD